MTRRRKGIREFSQYVTKDSGAREEYDSGMRRDSQDGKANFHLVIPKDVPYEDQMFTRWAALMTRGAEKYGERNWELADSEEELERFKSSAFRHFMQWISNEQDEDHAAAVYFNIAAAEYVKHKLLEEEIEKLLLPMNSCSGTEYHSGDCGGYCSSLEEVSEETEFTLQDIKEKLEL